MTRLDVALVGIAGITAAGCALFREWWLVAVCLSCILEDLIKFQHKRRLG
jgi:hypothetical protein